MKWMNYALNENIVLTDSSFSIEINIDHESKCL